MSCFQEKTVFLEEKLRESSRKTEELGERGHRKNERGKHSYQPDRENFCVSAFLCKLSEGGLQHFLSDKYKELLPVRQKEDLE